MRRPGQSDLIKSFEPGHAAWKAAVIAIRPPAHKKKFYWHIYKINDLEALVKVPEFSDKPLMF